MSTKNAYRLMNPYVEGTLDTMVRARNSFSAGKQLYKSLSNYFTNHVENFYMTIQNVETKDLTHFKVAEKKGNNNTVDFKLVKLDDNFPTDVNEKLISNVEKLERQSGGKHRDDDSSDSDSLSSESEIYNAVAIAPITKFVYFSLPYPKLNFVGMNPLDINRLFMPMFSLPVNPTFEIIMDIYKFN